MVKSKGISFDDLQAGIEVSEAEAKWARMRNDFASLDHFVALKAINDLDLKKMFGGLAIRVGSKLCLVLMESSLDYRYKNKVADFPIWDGVLVCTSREHHRALVSRIKTLIEHPILPKWLYLRRGSKNFDQACKVLCSLLLKRTDLMGVINKKPKRSARLGDSHCGRSNKGRT